MVKLYVEYLTSNLTFGIFSDFLAYDESRTISAGIGSPVDNTKMKPLPNV